MEDFSLNLLCKERLHLLPLTLDTLKPQNGSFEVLLLDAEGSGRLKELASHYPELSIRIEPSSGANLAEMMNQGVALSKGKYIQFLEPGDRYISQHGIAFLSSQIGSEPHLVYGGSREEGGASDRDFIRAKAPLFLRSKVLEMGGFDGRLSFCPVMDFLCRLGADQKTEALFCRRVLIDSATEERGSLKETWKVLYRYFGFWRALKWVFVQDRLFGRTASFFKRAFWKE